MDNMKILWFGAHDPDGFGVACSNTINRHSSHECRVATLSAMQGFDSDIVFKRDFVAGINLRPEPYWIEQFVGLLKWCDLFVINIGLMPPNVEAKGIVDESKIRFGDFALDEFLKKTNKKTVAFLYGNDYVRENFAHYRKMFRTRKWSVLTNQFDIYERYSKDTNTGHILPSIEVTHPRYRNSIFDFVEPGKFEVDPILVSYYQNSEDDNVVQDAIKMVIDSSKGKPRFIAAPLNGKNYSDYLHMLKRSHIYVGLSKTHNIDISTLEAAAMGNIIVTSLGQDECKRIDDLGLSYYPWHRGITEKGLLKEALESSVQGVYEKMLEGYNFMREGWTPENLVGDIVEQFKKVAK